MYGLRNRVTLGVKLSLNHQTKAFGLSYSDRGVSISCSADKLITKHLHLGPPKAASFKSNLYILPHV